jgi:hypothetical protein
MSQPPIIQTPIFNSSYFSSNTDALTLQIADKRYLNLGGGTLGGALIVGGNLNAPEFYRSGSLINTSALVGVVAGTALANKALILDGSTNITDINQITCGAVITTGLTASSATINGDLNIAGGNYKLNGTTLDFSNLG